MISLIIFIVCCLIAAAVFTLNSVDHPLAALTAIKFKISMYLLMVFTTAYYFWLAYRDVTMVTYGFLIVTFISLCYLVLNIFKSFKLLKTGKNHEKDGYAKARIIAAPLIYVIFVVAVILFI